MQFFKYFFRNKRTITRLFLVTNFRVGETIRANSFLEKVNKSVVCHKIDRPNEANKKKSTQKKKEKEKKKKKELERKKQNCHGHPKKKKKKKKKRTA